MLCGARAAPRDGSRQRQKVVRVYTVLRSRCCDDDDGDGDEMMQT